MYLHIYFYIYPSAAFLTNVKDLTAKCNHLVRMDDVVTKRLQVDIYMYMYMCMYMCIHMPACSHLTNVEGLQAKWWWMRFLPSGCRWTYIHIYVYVYVSDGR